MEILLFILSIFFNGLFFAFFGVFAYTKFAELSKLSDKVEKALDAAKVAEDNARLSRVNSILRERQKDYKDALTSILDVLTEDTAFVRSTFFQRFGAVPEYQELNSQILAFSTRIDGIKTTLREFRMIDDYEE